MDYDDAWVDRMIFGEKICRKCLTPWPRNSEHFQRDGNNADGLKATCKDCMRVANMGISAEETAPVMSHI